MMLVVFMWAALPLYWGSLAAGPKHAPSLKAWVVDFDGGPLGAFVTESVMNSTKVCLTYLYLGSRTYIALRRLELSGIWTGRSDQRVNSGR